MNRDWGQPIRLHELARGALRLRLEPDAAERSRIAVELGLESLPALTADVDVRSWLDGVEVSGRFHAVVEQVCSLTLETFQQPLDGTFEVRAVPASSPNAPAAAPHELELDAEAPDPPDVLQGDEIDVAGYVVEHLALEIDPFPRKPGAAFDFEPPPDVESPFAALAKLKDPKG